jgi:hypothetical protein
MQRLEAAKTEQKTNAARNRIVKLLEGAYNRLSLMNGEATINDKTAITAVSDCLNDYKITDYQVVCFDPVSLSLYLNEAKLPEITPGQQPLYGAFC